MSNKSNGTAFEREFAERLSDEGFWVHRMQDNQNGQPFDVIAAKDGVTYAFDCKDCQGSMFVLSRIEENQHNAMALWAETGNKPGLFAIRMDGAVFLIPHKMLNVMQKQGVKSMRFGDLMHYGQGLERWLKAKKSIQAVMECK